MVRCPSRETAARNRWGKCRPNRAPNADQLGQELFEFTSEQKPELLMRIRNALAASERVVLWVY